MKRTMCMAFGLVVLLAGACKKKENPIIDDEEDPKKEVVLLLGKLTEKSVMRVQVSEAGDMADVEFTNHKLYEYSADSLLVKTTMQYDQPQELEFYWTSVDGIYDTYEYSADRLVKRSEFRRRYSEPSAPIELDRYVSYQYDDTGRVKTASIFSLVRTPPNGDFAFKETTVSTYAYDAQNRLTRTESFGYRFEGGEQQILTSKWIAEYTYGSDGNIAKQTEYRGYDSNFDGQIEGPELDTKVELAYSGYGTQPNPMFNAGLPIDGTGLFTIFKHFPTTVKRTVTLLAEPSIPPLISADSYQFTHRDDGYPASAKADLESKFIVQGGVIEEEKKTVNYEFTYQE